MKKLSHLLALASAGALSFGCIVTDYNAAGLAANVDNINLSEDLVYCSADHAAPSEHDGIGDTKDLEDGVSSLALAPLSTSPAAIFDGTACANLGGLVFTPVAVGKENAKDWYKQVGSSGNESGAFIATIFDVDGDGTQDVTFLDGVGVKDLGTDCDGNGSPDLRLTTFARTMPYNPADTDGVWTCMVGQGGPIGSDAGTLSEASEGEIFGSRAPLGDADTDTQVGYVSLDRLPGSNFGANVAAGNPALNPIPFLYVSYTFRATYEHGYDADVKVKDSEGYEATMLDALGGQDLFIDLENGLGAGFRLVTDDNGAVFTEVSQLSYDGQVLQLDSPIRTQVNLESRTGLWNPGAHAAQLAQIQAWADQVLPRAEDGNYGPFEFGGAINLGGQVMDIPEVSAVINASYFDFHAGDRTLGQRASIDRDFSTMDRR